MASGASNGNHGSRNGNAVATRPTRVNPTAETIVAALTESSPEPLLAACRSTRYAAADNPDTAATVAGGPASASATTVSNTASVATGRNRTAIVTAATADVAATRVDPCAPMPTAATISTPHAVDKTCAANGAPRLITGVRSAADDDRVRPASTDPGCGPPARPPRQRLRCPYRGTWPNAAAPTSGRPVGPGRCETGRLAVHPPPPPRDRGDAGRSAPARIRYRAASRTRRRSHPSELPPAAPMFQWCSRIRRQRRGRCRARDRTGAARCRHPASGVFGHRV